MNVQYPMGGLRGARTISVMRGGIAIALPSESDSTPTCWGRDFQMATEIPAQAEAVAGARHQLGKLLKRSGLSECADTVMLVAQELMVNAMVHGCENNPALPFSLRATHEHGCLRVEVEDPSMEQPHPRPPSADEEGGRGLHLVDALVTRWGTDSSAPGPGKTVWFELDLGAEEAAS
ncbi:ATP-binding protein [Streptomyces sp. NPDC008343]|uniref:ATP-binding protein n=1 Tax=Streptomyces sp. NPDC008343 TaxID=3364828 RepID=UPI0036E25CAC